MPNSSHSNFEFCDAFAGVVVEMLETRVFEYRPPVKLAPLFVLIPSKCSIQDVKPVGCQPYRDKPESLVGLAARITDKYRRNICTPLRPIKLVRRTTHPFVAVPLHVYYGKKTAFLETGHKSSELSIT